MIPHPIMFFDNRPPVREKRPMWKAWLKTLGGWIVRLGPGLVGAIMEAKARKEAETPPQK